MKKLKNSLIIIAIILLAAILIVGVKQYIDNKLLPTLPSNNNDFEREFEKI